MERGVELKCWVVDIPGRGYNALLFTGHTCVCLSHRSICALPVVRAASVSMDLFHPWFRDDKLYPTTLLLGSVGIML